MQNPRNKLSRAYAAIAGAILLALAFGFWTASRGESNVESVNVAQPTPTSDTTEPAYRHPLTGLPSDQPFETLPRVFAVMIDNAADAWPVSGVDKAFLVIEAPVEAAIPRLEAFFADDENVPKIGPVRSARPYFVDWANEFDALYAHVGGSDAALDRIATSGTFDLNEYFHTASFWRASDRFAPHNAYTSTERLAAAVERVEGRGEAPEVAYGVWGFREGKGTEGTKESEESEESEDLEISFHSELYAVRWEFDAELGKYLRWQGGRAAVTADGTRIAADNVVVVETDIVVLDAVGRRRVRTTGEGTARVSQDGVTIEATWKKPSASERLRFYDAAGEEILMRPGVTWVEVVSDGY